MQTNIIVAPNGRMVIPAHMRSALGLQSGGSVVARLQDGAVILEPIDVAIARAQAMVARYVPAGVSLAAELVEERHRAAEHE